MLKIALVAHQNDRKVIALLLPLDPEDLSMQGVDFIKRLLGSY